MRRKIVLALTTGLCAATLFGVASAQQTQVPAPAPAPATPPAGAESSAGQQSWQGMRGYGMRGDGMRGHGMGGGYGMGGGMGGGYGGRNMSEQDRAAFFAAHLASVRAGLTLTPEQEKLWPPLESAVRDAARQRQEWRDRLQKEGRPASPVDAMRRMAEISTARGETLKRVADAAAPLYSSLSDDQKRRLNVLAHGRMGAMMGLGSSEGSDRYGRGGGMRSYGDHEGRGGYGGGRHHHDHHQGERGHRWRQGSMDQDGRHGRGARNAADFEGFDRGAGLEDWRRL